MASKPAHGLDNSVVERRLRPIYEWLDNGNYKKALQECDKVLKKTPNLQCAKALKALALLRNGKESDCTHILDALTTEKPCDDATLQAMTLCYRELQQLEKIHPLYETAIKLEPTNEELHTHLFMAYVRISDFQMQQKAAMALYKLKPKNPYYCWAVMSIILQAKRGHGSSDEKKKQLLLSLAERMIDKLITDNKLEAEQEVQLYIMVLELQNKYKEVLKIIEGPLGEKLVNGSLHSNRLPYLIKLNRWSEVNILCKKILIENIDKWDVWKNYIDSVFEIIALESGELNNHVDNHDSGDNDLESVDNTPEKAHEFICRLVENGADNGYLLRGPYLARFQLLSKLVKEKIDTTDLLGETLELFIEYFRKFGHKPCCVSDLRSYLSLLDEEKKSELACRLIKDVGISSTSVPQTEQQMQRHICALQLSRLCGSHRNLSEDHLKAIVTAFSLHYQHGYQTYGTNLLSTDQGPSDAYALLASHILYDLYVLSKKSEPLILALVLLENLLKNSPSNYHAKLLCIRLYLTLGGPIGAFSAYDNLDVKHLQLDSLGFVLCNRLPTTGLYYLFSGLYDTTLKFVSTNYKDSSDHLTFSYKYGSFIKLDEFMYFRERMNNSVHYAMVSIESIILNLMEVNSIDNLYILDLLPKDNNIKWNLLRDNYDWNVFQSWDPERIECPQSNRPDIALLFEQDINLLKLRNQMLQSLYITVCISKSLDGTREKYSENLSDLLKDWEQMYTNIPQSNFTPLVQNIVTLPLPSRLHTILDIQYPHIACQLFKLVKPLLNEDLPSMSLVMEESQKNLTKILQIAKDRIDKQNTSEDCFLNRRQVMEEIVNIFEILNLSAIISGICLQIVKPAQIKKTKKKPESKTRELLLDFASSIKGNLLEYEQILESWTPNVECDLSDRLNALNLNSDSQTIVLNNLKDSHSFAVNNMKTMLKAKVKLLDGVIG